MCYILFDAIDPGSTRLLTNFFFSLFKFQIRKAFIFNKNEGNNKKVENKVSGRVRVSVSVALLSQ